MDDDFILSSGCCNNVKFRCYILFFRDLMLHMVLPDILMKGFFQSNITRNVHKFCDGSFFMCGDLFPKFYSLHVAYNM